MGTLPMPQLQKLLPGDVAFAYSGDLLETLLGSCVSIILTDPRRTTAAMCHVVHGMSHAPQPQRNGAFGPQALQQMADGLRQRGIDPAQCEAYVFGGGDMFPHLEPRLQVGQDNADWALQALQTLGARVVTVDLGGTVYRKLRWTVGEQAPEVESVAV